MGGTLGLPTLPGPLGGPHLPSSRQAARTWAAHTSWVLLPAPEAGSETQPESPPTRLVRARPALLSQPAGSLSCQHPSLPKCPPCHDSPQASEQELRPTGWHGAAGPSRQGRPGYRGGLSAGLGAPPWPSQHGPLSPAPPGPPGSALGLGAASFPAVQWFLPMAPAQSDDSGQFHRQGRAPSSRPIRYHGDWSPPRQKRGGKDREAGSQPSPATLGAAPPTPAGTVQTRATHGGWRVLKQPVAAFNGLWGEASVGAGAPMWLGAHGPQPQSISGSSASVSAAQRSSRAASEPGQKRIGR